MNAHPPITRVLVLAIEDEDSGEVSKEFLNFVMSKLDDDLSDDQKLAFLQIAGSGIKGGSLNMMPISNNGMFDGSIIGSSIEFECIENDFCTENMSNENHESLCLTKENTYKRK